MAYKHKNGDIISVDLRAVFQNATVYGQYFVDENGNAEIYVPASENCTSFNIKLPNTLDKQTK